MVHQGRGLHLSTSQLNLNRFRHKVHFKHPLILPDTLTPPEQPLNAPPSSQQALTLSRKVNECKVSPCTKAAEAGSPTAMFNVGLWLDTGKGVPAPDYPAAAGWYKRAANAGYGPAADNLATMYTVGRGVTRSKQRAGAYIRPL